MKKTNPILILTLLTIFFSSCRKMIEVDPPRNQLVTSVVFKDSADATSAIVGIYSKIMQFSTGVNIANGALTIYTGLAADEIIPVTTADVPQEFYKNDVLSLNEEIVYWWEFAYQIIYQANACIEGLNKSTTLGADVKNQLLGEANFIRAWMYFNLVNLYGDIPLITSINYHINSQMSRGTVDKVYIQVISDLTEAQLLLPADYTSTGRLRPNKHTATSLLSRAYLFQKQWNKSETEASKLISAGVYQLETNLNNVFLASSKESIWQMPPLQSPLGTPECRQFTPFGSDIPNYTITPSLLNAFDTGDLRRDKWIGSTTPDTVTYFFPYKYKLRTSVTTDEHYVVFRLSEQYLIRAEARVMQDNLAGALDDLNVIKNRAGLAASAVTTKEAIITDIINERRKELFCEGAHRWFDLKRFNIINDVLSLVKPGWQPTDALFPIPHNELQRNPFLVQNPGY